MAQIAIDARAAVRPELGGVERWARELCARLPYRIRRRARGSCTAPATRGSSSRCRR